MDLHYNLHGTKNRGTIVLIHGFAVDSSIWNPILNELAQSYQVLTLDLRGHG